VRGTYLARDLVNTPANVANPEYLAAAASALARDGRLEVSVGDAAWAAEQGMGALLAVSRGSANEPRFITMELSAAGTGEYGEGSQQTVVLVGKDDTFDTGGFSLKTRDCMVPMMADM